MKKWIALLLCVMLVFSMTACGQKNNAGTDKAETAGTPPPDTSNKGEPLYIDRDAASMTGTVNFYTAFDGQYGTSGLIEEFNKNYPNVKVKYTVYKNSTEGNLTADTAIMANEVDVILSFGTHNTASRWENGLLLDITNNLAKDNLDLVKEWGTKAYTYNNKVYCFPAGGLSIFVAINLDMWNAAGLGPIPKEWTWDEYIKACKAMMKVDSAGKTTVYGGTDFNQRDYWTYALRQTKGVDAFYNSKGRADFDNPLCETILSRELDAEAKGIWYKKINLLTNSITSRDLLWKGSVASCVESIITRFVMDTKNYPHDFKLGYAPYPVNKAGETNYALGNMPNSFFCVTKNAKDAKAAYAFAKFASTIGSKYLYKAGHTSTWTGVNANEIVDLVFGSRKTAEQFADVDSYIANVLAIGAPAYHEEYIVAYSKVASLLDEYTDYILSGQMSVKDGLAKLNKLANDAIEEKLKK